MKRYISLFQLLFLMATMAFADSFDMKIGDQKYIKNSATNVSNQLSCKSSWSKSGSCIDIVTSGNYGCYVYARSEGYATITCSWSCTVKVFGSSNTITQSGTDYFYVTVKSNKPESVSVSPSSLELNVGDSRSLTATVSPSGAEYSYINWTSSNTTAASISGSGRTATVTALQPTTSPVVLRATTDNGKYGQCSLTIYGTNPTALSITQPGTLIAEGSGTQLTATFTPSNHKSSITWSSSNSAIASVSSSGYVTPIAPGTATITAKSGNGLTAKASVTVVEPAFTIIATTPNSYAYDVDVLTSCSVTYSLPIHAGSNTSGVTLTGGGQQVTGQLTISGSTLTFKPYKALLPQTTYTLKVPQNCVLNKWGTSYPASSLTFTTGQLRPMALNCSLSEGFVESGEKAYLWSTEIDATICYTLDGSEPTQQSTHYDNNPIVIDHNLTLRAKAFKDGYETPQIKADYKLTTIRIAQYYPKSDEELYIYKDMNPFVQYTFDVKKGPNFQECKVSNKEGQRIDGSFLLNEKTLAFVPEKPLPLGESYTVSIPQGAIMVNEEDLSKTLSWTFVTGLFYRSISAGYESHYALRTDGQLVGWGEFPSETTGNFGFNSDFYTSPPRLVATDVKRVSSGATHMLYSKYDGTLYAQGRQYCGELGNGQLQSVSTAPIKLQEHVDLFTAGTQTTAFVQNGTVMGAGRNDFKLMEDAANLYRSNTGKTDAQVENIRILESGYGNFYAVTADGKLYGWGDNSFGHLLNGTKTVEEKPVLMMEDVDTVAASKWKEGNVAIIKRDGSLWTWGNNNYGQLGNGTHYDSTQPVKVMDNVSKISLGFYCMAAITNDGNLWMWGLNNGQLGLGSGDTEDKTTPQLVKENIADVSLGFDHTVALDSDGSVFFWGTERTGKEFDYAVQSPYKYLSGRSSQALTDVSTVTKIIKLDIGDKAVVCAKPVPLNANYTEWTWTTSDASIATVSERGVVTGVGEGQATITLISDEGKTAACQVMVSGTADGITEIADPSAVVFDVYDLQGHKVRSRVTTIEGLPRGIYIIGGRKVVIQ